MQLAHQNPALVPQYAPMMAELIEWWADILAEPNGNCGGLGEAAQQIMSSWNQVLLSDGSLGPVILPCVLKSLNSKHQGVRETNNAQIALHLLCFGTSSTTFIHLGARVRVCV